MTAILKKTFIVGWALFLWFIFFGPFVMPANSAEVPSATFEAGDLMWRAEKYNSAIDIWSELAENGNERAAWILFGLYAGESPIGPANMKKAMEWLVKLSNANVADAREVMGDIYYFGRGVPQNYNLAAEWYEKYVKIERDSDILTRYAMLLAAGQGTKENKLRAFKMLFEAGQVKHYLPAYLVATQVFNEMTLVDQFLARLFIQEQARKPSN